MSGDVVQVAIMRQALRELGEGFAVYSGQLKRASRISGQIDPKRSVVNVGFTAGRTTAPYGIP
jgi:hypothetical protein